MPVATARQCLTEEAARALDDAVSIAKRRNHSQTTSLHVLSALLSPSFSLLRESLSRCRNSSSVSGYSTRFQFRVLELCVSVSLEKVPSSKTAQNDDFVPPIANSLMAAIKRAQANQRRQPEMYHLNQIHLSNNPISISSIKVELKHFVLAILDDPNVSRVFGDAGYWSPDVKLAIIHPPIPRWAAARCPPMFMDFPGVGGNCDADDNCRRIGEVMMMKNTDKKSPLLIGVCAKDALLSFKDCLEKGRYGGFPSEIHGLKLVCMEREIGKFVRKEKEGFNLKLKEVSLMMENSCSGPGVVVNLGELRVLLKEEGSSSSTDGGDDHDDVNELVMKISGLIEVYGKKIWLIGAAANYETYSKFVGRFPSIQEDWDLHPLPITSFRSSFDALGSKSSLLGSFVPFGGFFPSQPDFRTPLTVARLPFTRCNACNEMYERELSDMLREGSSVSIADTYSKSLSSSLQRSDSDRTKGGDVVAQVKDVKAASSEQIMELQKKWNDHCRQLHQILTRPAGVPFVRPLPPHNLAFQFVSKEAMSTSTGESNEGVCSNPKAAMQAVSQSLSPQHKAMSADFPNKALAIPERSTSVREHSASPAYASHNVGLPLDYKSAPTVSVTTDLGLGTIYASKSDTPKTPLFQDQGVHLRHSQGFNSSDQGITGRKDPEQRVQSSFHQGPGLKEGLDPADYKLLFRKLSEVVASQGEAIGRVCEIISSCRSGNGHQCPSSKRGSIWLTFHGPDKIGKRKVAEALADAVFGSRDCLVVLDLSSQDTSSKANSLFLCQGTRDFDINLSRITVVDHITQELSRKPHSIVFLESIDEADPLLQNSLSHAIQMGKFQDSRGREISISNAIFIATSCMANEDKSISPRKEFIKFPEEKILEAKNWQMQVTIKNIPEMARRSNITKVSLVSAKSPSVYDQGTSKRKASNCSSSLEDMEVEKRVCRTPKHSLDLNLSLEEATEIDSYDGDSLSDSLGAWLEDFFGQADGNVVFKPLNFDALADKFLTKIRVKFEETFRRERTSLEIDDEVMVQILAASWCAEKQGAAEEWIEHVLGVTFSEALERFQVTDESVVRLASCEGVPVNQWASGIRLPRSINLSILI